MQILNSNPMIFSTINQILHPRILYEKTLSSTNELPRSLALMKNKIDVRGMFYKLVLLLDVHLVFFISV